MKKLIALTIIFLMTSIVTIAQIDQPVDKDIKIAENLFLYQDSTSGFYGLQDENRKKITPAQFVDFDFFQNGLCIVQSSNEKFGVINLSGKTIIPFEYDYVSNDYNSNQFMVAINEKYGLLNREGKILIPIQYENISFINEGYAAFSSGEKFGILNEMNEIVIPATYSLIFSINSSHFIAVENDNYILINIKNNKTLASGYDYISTTEEPNLFIARKNSKYGFLNAEGKVVIPFIYVNATAFKDGIAQVLTADIEVITINTQGEKVDHIDAALENSDVLEALKIIEKASLEAMEAAKKK